MDTSETDPRERQLRDAIAGLDVEALARRYQADGGVIVLPPLVPAPLLGEMIDEARRLAADARRMHVPLVRKARAVPHQHIARAAPALHALQQSPSLLALLQRIAGRDLERARDSDPQASALYAYRDAGDHVGWHRDDCGCEPEASFTALLGLASRGSSRLQIDLHHDEPGARPVVRSIATTPGTFLFFRGSSTYHRITPLARGDERISYSMVFVKKGHHPKGFDAVYQTMINTFLYFGVDALGALRAGAG